MEFHLLLLSCLLCSVGGAQPRTSSLREVSVQADARVQKQEGGPPRTPSRGQVLVQAKVVRVKSAPSIPKQLICTGKPENFEELSEAEQTNIRHTLALNPGLNLKYLGDHACYEYLFEHFKDSPLVGYYKTEPMGMYRGDVCRTAVLALEGGYYTDLDVALELPFSKLVNSEVSFASVLCGKGHAHEVLNAVMIAAPGHPVMKQTLVKMVDWYKEDTRREFLGTLATMEALQDFQSYACPEETISSFLHATTCGEGKVRMLEEKMCDDTAAGCPKERLHSQWTKYGLYDENGRRFGWSRYAECRDLSCGGTGRRVDLLEVNTTAYVSSHRSRLLQSAPQN